MHTYVHISVSVHIYIGMCLYDTAYFEAHINDQDLS